MGRKLKITAIILAFGTVGLLAVNAEALASAPVNPIFSAFRSYKVINVEEIRAPAVVEVPFKKEGIERLNFAVLDKTTDTFKPYYLRRETGAIPLAVSTVPRVPGASKMLDGNTATYANFPLPEDAQGKATIALTSEQPVTSSALTVLLDNHVALPTSVEIRANVEGKNVIVVAKRKMSRHTIRFPRTTSSKWTIKFTFSQPLRISELRLRLVNTAPPASNAARFLARLNQAHVRFLAQPNHTYYVYFDPDRTVKVPVGEAGNLATAEDVMPMSAASRDNPAYVIADSDNDGVPDINDNCVSVANPGQEDINNNGRGDACDDWDLDGIINSKDNCRDQPNRNQKDADGDGMGDACDEEESRITERYPWIPWLGIGFAAVVLILLFALTAKSAFTTEGKK